MQTIPVTVEGSAGVMELFGIAETFLDTLHGVMKSGADEMRKNGDLNDAEQVEMFEYNWLSIFGYSKGIIPLITDFYFNYFHQETFVKNNGHFIRDIKRLIVLFTSDGSPEEIYLALDKLVGGSLGKNLFNDGVIKTFLTEFQAIINKKPTCMRLVNVAKLRASEISKFLNFVLKGAPKEKENNKPVNSEL